VQEDNATIKQRCRRKVPRAGRGVEGTRQAEVQTNKAQADTGEEERGTRQAEVQKNKAPRRQRCRRTRR
jgi:hypothetical protein